jgi:heat-inducible transcriptional repressor
MNKKILDISDRARLVFKFLVEDYLKNGNPMGSKSIRDNMKLNLSSATIRNVLSEINFHGLISRDHHSAGSTPSDFGLQFYTSALLELGQINDKERKIIDESSSQDEYHHEQKKITEVLNFLSKQTSLVVNEEKITKITKIDFYKIDLKKLIFIIQYDDGAIANRLVELDSNIEDKDLNLVSNFLLKFKGSFLPSELEKKVSSFLKDTKNSIDSKSKYLISKGLEIEGVQDGGSFFIRGIGNLMQNNQEVDIDNLNELLNDIETGKIAKKLIQALKKSTGVQIFIGSNTNLFKQSNMSMILSNYTTKQGVTGAVGIIGPKRIDYQKIIPIISYMSEVISKK